MRGGRRLGWLAVLGIVHADASARPAYVVSKPSMTPSSPGRRIVGARVRGEERVTRLAARQARGVRGDDAATGPPRRNGQGLDDTDRAIIEQLQQDGRLPYTRLASAVGLSEAAVRQRVQRLLDTGAMQVVAVTDPLSLGLRRMALIGVRVEGDTSAVAEQLEAFARHRLPRGHRRLVRPAVRGGRRGRRRAARPHQPHPLGAGVRSTETFIYLSLVKQTYAWGAH